MKKFCGVSILELMVSLSLASFLLTIALSQAMQFKSSTKVTVQRLTAESEALWVMDWVRSSIYMAGFTPCANIERLMRRDMRINNTELTAITVFEDKLQCNRMSDKYAKVLAVLTPTRLMLTNNINPNAHTVLIADCYHAEVQTLNSLDKTAEGWTSSLAAPLNYTYKPPVYIGEWLEAQFFIKKNPRGLAALYYREQHSEELTPWIKRFSVKKDGQSYRINLSLDTGRDLHIQAMVRAP